MKKIDIENLEKAITAPYAIERNRIEIGLETYNTLLKCAYSYLAMVQKENYNLFKIYKNLIRTATGESWCGDKLYAAKDLPFLTIDEKWLLGDIADKGIKNHERGMLLQDIAIKIYHEYLANRKK